MDESWIVPPRASPIHGDDAFVGTDATVNDFWRFAMSDLRMNNTRGYLAEFLAAKALGLHEVNRIEWDAYDLLLDGIRVEVKSSAHLQAREQPRPSRIGFSGLKGTRYHPKHQYDPAGKQLNAHVYVLRSDRPDARGIQTTRRKSMVLLRREAQRTRKAWNWQCWT